MSRLFAVIGGLLFAGSLLFFVASFGWRFGGGGTWSWTEGARPALVDVLMFTAFALHHSLFARIGVKSLIERRSPHLERAIYVWAASLLLIIVCAWWQSVPGTLWRFSGLTAGLLRSAQLAGAILSVVSARRLDTLSLAGVRQAMQTASSSSERPEVGRTLDDQGPYSLVRHPIYLGWFLMVWCAPVMNGTRLVFAAISCLYLVVAIPYEERDLRRTFGDAYARYAARVTWRVVPFLY